MKGAQVILFGRSEGIEELSGQQGIIFCPDVLTSAEGTPRIDDMFIRGQQLAEHDICCFINADIITTSVFSQAVISVHEKLKKHYLIVGQRYNISMDHLLDFHEGWDGEFQKLISGKGTLHPPMGSDYFAFPRGQYRNMPSLLVGRGGWDLWMIYDGRRRNLKVTDLSEAALVYHQDHDYKHRKQEYAHYTQDEEALENLRHLPAGETYDYTLYACNFSFSRGKLHRNFSRKNIGRYIKYERRLLQHRIHNNTAYRIMRELFRHLQAMHKRNKLKQQISRVGEINIIIGSGGTVKNGWLSTDKDVLDITSHLDWMKYFKPGSVDRILAEHVFEHLTETECRAALRECSIFMKKTGLLRIAVPDGYRKDTVYTAEVTPPKDDHHQLLTVDTLATLLKSCGFQTLALEYFDAEGNFNHMPWDVEDGFVMRSMRFDRQEGFKLGDLYYTSLIMDARKT